MIQFIECVICGMEPKWTDEEKEQFAALAMMLKEGRKYVSREQRINGHA